MGILIEKDYRILEMKIFRKSGNIVENLIRELKENYSDNMEAAANIILKKFNISSIPIPIVKIMKLLDFEVIVQNYEFSSTLSGIIGIDYKLKDIYKSDKVISVNRKDNLGHQRFTMAHELCHYIFDFDRNNKLAYYDGYDTQNINQPAEKRANTFAANLLMPRDLFIKAYKDLSNLYLYDKVAELAKLFQVSETAISKRIDELRNDL